jgi:hypothetical protein
MPGFQKTTHSQDFGRNLSNMFALIIFALVVITNVLASEFHIVVNPLLNQLVWAGIVSLLTYVVGINFPNRTV